MVSTKVKRQSKAYHAGYNDGLSGSTCADYPNWAGPDDFGKYGNHRELYDAGLYEGSQERERLRPVIEEESAWETLEKHLPYEAVGALRKILQKDFY